MRVLVFGDSITQGYWDTEGGWVERLRRHFDEQQTQNLRDHDEPVIFNLGISADNTADILLRVEAETRARTRHAHLPVALLQIGTNDSSRRGESVPIELEAYKRNLEAIIRILQPLTAKLIFVGLSACDETKTMPVFWGNYFYSNQAIKDYETAMGTIAEQHDIDFLPIFDKFLAALKAGQNLLADGLHPNNIGHDLLTGLLLPDLEKLLSQPSTVATGAER